MAILLNLWNQRDSGALVLNLGATQDPARTAVMAGRTRHSARGLLAVLVEAYGAGRTAGCRGMAVLAYDPNLLSDTVAVLGATWNEGEAAIAECRSPVRDGEHLNHSAALGFDTAEPLPGATTTPWRPDTERAIGQGTTGWNEAESVSGVERTLWRLAEPAQQAISTHWQDAAALFASSSNDWNARLPRLECAPALAFSDGLSLPTVRVSGFNDGERLSLGWETAWQEAGLAYNAWQPPAVVPSEPEPPTVVLLNLKNSRAGLLVLNLGGGSYWNVYDRRYYGVLNTCSVVRLPDRTELPVTAVSAETDCDSWGWSFSLSLAGSEAWTLCQPDSNGLPREIEISINGLLWTAMLDDPQWTRGFNSTRLSAKGISRSGWMTTPYTKSETVTQLAPRTGQQIAESIVNDTGWALDWQLPPDPQWLIPAGHYVRTGTSLDRLVDLVKSVKGCLYSHPSAYSFIAYPRYPTLPWEWNNVQADVSLPESALLSWNQTQQNHPPVNRVYVSGTTAGVLLQLTKAGTAGDLCPSDPIVDSLLTDSYSARHRAEMELAGAGTGYQVQVETILGGTENIPLIRPGLLCEFAGIRGIVRSTSINVSRSGGGLAVRQGLTLERRTGPWR